MCAGERSASPNPHVPSAVPCDQPQAISQHLRLLTHVGLLEQRREGTKRLYRVHKQAFGELRTFLEVFWTDRLSVLKRQVETRKGAKRDEG
jgi:DNA-binding transcriptional ArsR family regulator